MCMYIYCQVPVAKTSLCYLTGLFLYLQTDQKAILYSEHVGWEFYPGHGNIYIMDIPLEP